MSADDSLVVSREGSRYKLQRERSDTPVGNSRFFNTYKQALMAAHVEQARFPAEYGVVSTVLPTTGDANPPTSVHAGTPCNPP